DGGAAALEHGGGVIAEEVERIPQRCAPPLVPTGGSAGGAAAVLTPATHAVGARPRALLDGYFVLGMFVAEELVGVGDFDAAPVRFHCEGVGEKAVAVRVVMTERLAISGDGDKAALGGGPNHTLYEILTRHRAKSEGQVVREAAVVEEDVDSAAATRRVAPAVRHGRVERMLVVNLVPPAVFVV